MSLPIYTQLPSSDPSSSQKVQPLADDNDPQVSDHDHSHNAPAAVYPPVTTASAAAISTFALPPHLANYTLQEEALLWSSLTTIGTRGRTKVVSRHPS